MLALINGDIDSGWVSQLITSAVAESKMAEPRKHALFREHERG